MRGGCLVRRAALRGRELAAQGGELGTQQRGVRARLPERLLDFRQRVEREPPPLFFAAMPSNRIECVVQSSLLFIYQA